MRLQVNLQIVVPMGSPINFPGNVRAILPMLQKEKKIVECAAREENGLFVASAENITRAIEITLLPLLCRVFLLSRRHTD